MSIRIAAPAAITAAILSAMVFSATPASAMRICGIMFDPTPGDQCRMSDGRICVVMDYGSSEDTVSVRCTRKVKARKRRSSRRSGKRKR